MDTCKVTGCGRSIFSKRDRLCAMHAARLRRTGELGPAESYISTNGVGTKRHNDNARKRLASAVKKLGRDVRLTPGQGAYEARPAKKASPMVRLANSTVTGWRDRGWVYLGEYAKDGTRAMRLSKEGSAEVKEAG